MTLPVGASVTLTTPGETLTPDATVRPGGLVGSQVPYPTRTEMSLKDLHQTGLLWWINKTLLWDLGLTLIVEVDTLKPGEGENSRRYVRLFVQDAVPPQRIVDGTDDTPQWEAFQRWLSNRAGTVR